MSKRNLDFMNLALGVAQKGFGKVSPNPMVGAVLVKNGKIIGKGWHKGFGLNHAEKDALISAAKYDIFGSTLYVNLEPCVFFENKKTDACSDLIVRSGIAKVFISHKDPNPKVCSRGISFLEKHGIIVELGLGENEANRINEVYIKNMSTSLPFIAVKIAGSLDGRISTFSGDSRWITNLPARKEVHRLRADFDAVMTTSDTVIADDCDLGVRYVKGSDPLRVIVDKSLKTNLESLVYRDGNVIVFCGRDVLNVQKEKFKKSGVELVVVNENVDGSGLDLRDILMELYGRGVMSVMVEAGGKFGAAILKSGFVDKFYYFIAPKFIGSDGIPALNFNGISSINDAFELKNVSYRQIGRDILVEGKMSS